jgi:hypothetical protein
VGVVAVVGCRGSADVALGDLQSVLLEIGGQFAHGHVLELFGAEPVQVFLDALALGHPSRVTTRRSRETGLAVL